MKALYRRYRPKTLSEVIGQEQITDILQNSLKNGKIAHAYLFIGPRGTGKTSVARILAHEINGFKYELEDDYLDIIEIDGASNNSVEDIRNLREKVMIAPTKGKYKIYIIDEVHMLSKSAFNALLKTLEEPPEHVIFIMATTDSYKVPITITSRSQIYTFKLANPSTMFDYLKQITKQEKIKITDEALKIIVKRGGGSFRDSLSLLDQISTLSDEKIDADLITQALGLPQAEAISNILNGYAAGDATRVREQLQNLLDTGIKPELIAENIINEILANPQPIHLNLLDKLLDVSRSAYPYAKLLLAVIPQDTALSMPNHAAAVSQLDHLRSNTAPKITPKPVSITKPEPAKKSTKITESKSAEKPTETVETTESDAPAPNEKPTPAAIATEPSADDAEIWNNILNFAHDKFPAISSFLQKADYVFDGDTLNIYTNASNAQKTSNKPSLNKQKLDAKAPMIAEFLGGKYTIEVSDQTLKKDPVMAGIAELMGGGEEVQIDAE